jgi:hypothetical protein
MLAISELSCTHLYNMSECAVGTDGVLKDASDIEWFHNVDDAEPISVPLANTSSASLSASASVHPFFTGRPAPAVFVASSRRSARVP